ncbi:MAG: hypothetical protein RTV31_06505 [Candidatus Thorarchaeota archaeon]
MTEKKEIDFNRIHFSLAGSGDPWSSLSRTRVRIMKELHDGLGLSEVASLLDLSSEEINSEIQPLLNASLMFEIDGQFKPTFLIANEDETLMVHNHASTFSKNLANVMEDNFEDIAKSYQSLDLSKQYKFEDVAFLFVGGRIVDIHLLDKLASGKQIMRPAPPRPSPERPDAHYYFWMIEGEKKHLGEYGLEDIDMPWPCWHYFSFGQNLIDGIPNGDREQMETRYSELIKTGTIETPEAIGRRLDIPIISQTDSVRWAAISDEYAKLLSQCFEEHEQSIKALHTNLKSGQYAPHSLGEFFCWYAHIAYSVTIDILELKGILPVPPERFQSALWYKEQGKEGLLAG